MTYEQFLEEVEYWFIEARSFDKCDLPPFDVQTLACFQDNIARDRLYDFFDLYEITNPFDKLALVIFCKYFFMKGLIARNIDKLENKEKD